MIAKALSSNNKDAFEDMLDQDSIGNAYAENYLHKIDGATDISARTAVLNETTIMSVTGKLKGGGDFCSQWQVVQNDGRWLLDAAPPILPSACR